MSKRDTNIVNFLALSAAQDDLDAKRSQNAFTAALQAAFMEYNSLYNDNYEAYDYYNETDYLSTDYEPIGRGKGGNKKNKKNKGQATTVLPDTTLFTTTTTTTTT